MLSIPPFRFHLVLGLDTQAVVRVTELVEYGGYQCEGG